MQKTPPNNLSLEELKKQLVKLKSENLLLKTKLEELTEGGGIKIFFSDKAQAKQIIYKVKPRILKELPRYSLNPEQSPNLIIEGDNLQALASLAKYRHKIDLILTDPPYNTGKDFRYNDKWNEDPNDEGLGNLIKADDPSKHTKWMKFMLPRLIVMREMLKDSGVLAICIDDNEISHLLPMLNEIFGEENRVGIINWQKNYGVRGDPKNIVSATEYVLVYAKDKNFLQQNSLSRGEKMLSYYKNPDNDPKGAWKPAGFNAQTVSRSLVYGIQNPFTGEIQYPPPMTPWRRSKSRVKPVLEQWGSEYEERDLGDGRVSALVIKGSQAPYPKDTDPLKVCPVVKEASKKAYEIYRTKPWPEIYFPKDGKGRLAAKQYLKDVQKKGLPPTTFWANEDFGKPLNFGSISWSHRISGHSQTGSSELKSRVKTIEKFIGVKPLKLFTKIIQIWSPPNGLILDTFAGSGTAGESILQLNKVTNTNRRFILIEKGNPNNSDNFCRDLLYPRLKSTITGQWADKKLHEPLLGNFRYLKLTKQIDSLTILQMEREELIDTILSTHLDAALLPNNTYLIAKNQKNEGIYLVWEANNKKRQSNITEKVYRQCSLERKKHNLTSTYHIYARTMAYSPSTIKFNKIPDHLLLEFGISLDERLGGKRK